MRVRYGFQVAKVLPSQLLQRLHQQQREPRYVFGAGPFLLVAKGLTLMIKK